jgi:hypothetical protein
MNPPSVSARWSLEIIFQIFKAIFKGPKFNDFLKKNQPTKKAKMLYVYFTKLS